MQNFYLWNSLNLSAPYLSHSKLRVLCTMFMQNTSQIEFMQTIFILGWSNFVGSNLKAHLSLRNVSFQSPSSAEINLKLRVTHKLLQKCFTPTTASVLLACITPNKGRGITRYGRCYANCLSAWNWSCGGRLYGYRTVVTGPQARDIWQNQRL